MGCATTHQDARVMKSYLDYLSNRMWFSRVRFWAPLSGEEDEQLRARPALREYYSSLDRHSESDKPAAWDSDEDIYLEERLNLNEPSLSSYSRRERNAESRFASASLRTGL